MRHAGFYKFISCTDPPTSCFSHFKNKEKICVCVCVRERERERELESHSVSALPQRDELIQRERARIVHVLQDSG